MYDIEYWKDDRGYLEAYNFIENGRIVNTQRFSTFNKGNKADEIVSKVLNEAFHRLKGSRGWNEENLSERAKDFLGIES